MTNNEKAEAVLNGLSGHAFVTHAEPAYDNQMTQFYLSCGHALLVPSLRAGGRVRHLARCHGQDVESDASEQRLLDAHKLGVAIACRLCQ